LSKLVERGQVDEDEPEGRVNIDGAVMTETERERGVAVELVRVDESRLNLDHHGQTSLEL